MAGVVRKEGNDKDNVEDFIRKYLLNVDCVPHNMLNTVNDLI